MKGKTKIFIILAVLFGSLVLGTGVYASERTETETYIVEIEVFEMPSVRSNVKSGNKIYTYKTSSGEMIFTYTLYATFSYDGESATCTHSADEYTIIDNLWCVTQRLTRRTGNQATGEATFKLIDNGNIIETVPVTITLSCTPDGTLY